MSSLVQIFERRSRHFVSALAKTAAGFWVESAHWEVPAPVTPTALVDAVTVALAHSRSSPEAPMPGREGNPARAMLDLVGVKSYSTFVKGTRAVAVSEAQGQITVTPMHNGAAAGFTELLDLARPVSADRADLEKALIEAFSRAT